MKTLYPQWDQNRLEVAFRSSNDLQDIRSAKYIFKTPHFALTANLVSENNLKLLGRIEIESIYSLTSMCYQSLGDLPKLNKSRQVLMTLLFEPRPLINSEDPKTTESD